MAQTDSAAVQATDNQIGTPAQRGKLNDSFGAFLEREIVKIVTSAMNSNASLDQIGAFAGALKRALRTSVGDVLGIRGGVAAGGIGGSGGSGMNLSVSKTVGFSKSFGVKKSFGFSKSINNSLAGGGGDGQLSGVATGALSLNSKMGGSNSTQGGSNSPFSSTSTGDFDGGIKSNVGGQQFNRSISEHVMKQVDASLGSSGLTVTERTQVREKINGQVTKAIDDTTTRVFGPPLGFPHVDGVPILDGKIVQQDRGKWFATFKLDAFDDKGNLTGPFVANINGVEYHGTVLPDRSGEWGGDRRVRVVGGSGGLDLELPPKNYSSGLVKFQNVFDDILRESGETASDESDPLVLNALLRNWHRSKGTASEALDHICDYVECQWRVLRDGTIWVGNNEWPEVEPNGTVTHEGHDEGIVRVMPDSASLVPGVVVRGQQIKRVVHHIDAKDPNGSLRTDCHARSEGELFDRILDKSKKKIEFSYRFWATVVRQNADGSVDVELEDQDMNGTGVGNCELVVGLPNVTLELQRGARCLVGWAGGDPSRPYVEGFAQLAPGKTFFGKLKRAVAVVGGTVKSLLPALMPFQGTVGGAPAAGVLTIVDAGIGIIENGADDPSA